MALPALLDSVVGQPRAVAALRAHVARTGGAGSVLVAGPEGTGRFLLALGAAQSILRAGAARVAALQHPDLEILDPDEGIDGVRRVLAALAYRPSEGPRRVLIVRDADRLLYEARNALLKTLEEPTADAAVFVIAERPDQLPETVVSRCRLVRAEPLAPETMRLLLARLGVPVGRAEEAEGSPGRALVHDREGSGEGAEALLELISARSEDAPGVAAALARRGAGEEAKAHRQRLAEILRIAAFRLRRRLPESEAALRSVVEALRCLGANVGGPLLFAELALLPWKAPPTT